MIGDNKLGALNQILDFSESLPLLLARLVLINYTREVESKRDRESNGRPASTQNECKDSSVCSSINLPLVIVIRY